MNKKPLDPNLASILDSIRATVSSDAPAEQQTSTWAEDTGDEEAPAPPVDSQREEAPAARTGPQAPLGSGRAPSRKVAPPPATRTVEDFLAELIRPQVEAWLSAHLPEIIQRQAAEEIARLTGRK